MVALGALVITAPAQATFTQEGSPIAVGVDPYTLVAADFNGDGGADVAALNGTNSTASVMLRQPAGGFAAEAGSPFAAGPGPSGGAVADYNGDGRLDMAIADFATPGSVTVLLRQAAGGFAAETPAPAVPTASSVAAADFNGTGAPTSPCRITAARR